MAREKRRGGPPRRSKRRRDLRPSIDDAVGHFSAGRFQDAREICQAIVQRDANVPQAWHLLGLIARESEQSDLAVETLRRAIQADPAYLLAYNDLGNLLQERGQFEQAIQAFQSLVVLSPQDSVALSNLGVAFKENQQYDHAIESLQKSCRLDPEFIKAWLNLGYAAMKAERWALATESFEKVLELDPERVEALDVLAHLFRVQRQPKNALAIYRRWLQLEPENPIATHMIRAMTSSEIPQRAPDEYVRAEFDSFADTFEEKLGVLNYQAPQHVANILKQRASDCLGNLDVLDAGCGTGLAADFLRPLAKQLIGVDLSDGMLAKARTRDVYDQLFNEELCLFLSTRRGQFDLVVSIDTLNYFGDLKDVFAHTAASLRTGGRFVFTLEHDVLENQEPFRILPSGRYAHRRDHVDAMLVAAGFHLHEFQEVILREESNQPVQGLLIWCEMS